MTAELLCRATDLLAEQSLKDSKSLLKRAGFSQNDNGLD